MNRSVMSRQMFKKGGAAFPDLSGDGQVTQKDILMGRGVIPKPMQEGGMMPPDSDMMMAPPPAAMMPPAPPADPMMAAPIEDSEMMGLAALQEESGMDPAMLEQFMAAAAQNFGDLETAEDYEEMINRLRGDQMPIAGRRQELAEFVGPEDAQRTPESVLAMVQPVIMLNEIDQGIGGLAQEQMMEPVTGDMAGGIMSTVAGVEEAPAPVNFREGGAVQKFADTNANRVAGIKPYFEGASSLIRDLIKPSMSAEDLAKQKRLTEAQMFFDLANAGLRIAAPPERSESLVGSIARGATESKLFDRIGARAQAQSELERDVRKEQQAMDLAGLNLAEKLYGTDVAAETALAKLTRQDALKDLGFIDILDKNDNVLVKGERLNKGDIDRLRAANPDLGLRFRETIETEFGKESEDNQRRFLSNVRNLNAYAEGGMNQSQKNLFESRVMEYVLPEGPYKYNPESGLLEKTNPKRLPDNVYVAIEKGNPRLFELITKGLDISSDREAEETAAPDTGSKKLVDNRGKNIADFKKELIDEKGDVRLEQFNFDTVIFDPNIDYGKYSIGFSRIGPGLGKTIEEAMAEIQNTKVGPEAAKKAQSDRDLQGLANQLLTYSNEQGPDGERILKFVQEKLALESAAIEPGGILFKTDADTQAALTFFAKKLAQDIKILAQRLPEYGGDAAGYKPADVTTAKRKIEQRKDLLNEVLAFARQFRGFDTNQLKLSDAELIERMDLGMSGDEFIDQLLMSKD